MEPYTPPYNPRQSPHRRRAEQSSSSVHTTTIIIAVCVGVASAVILLLLIRVILRMRARRPSRSAPLPPVQPLAHDRGRRLAQLDAWQDSSHQLATPVALGSTVFIGGSKTSLLTKDAESGFQEASRHASFAPSEITDEATVLAPASPLEPSLPLPNPSFHHNSASSSSIGFGSDTDVGSNSPTPPLTPSLSHASFSQLVDYRSRSDSPSSTSPARTTSQRKPRPVSSVSNASIHTTRSARNTLRGTPHNPHSNIQIILPAPLAPGLFPDTPIDDRSNVYGRQSVHYDPSAIRRMSLADKWAPPAFRTEVPGQRRSLSSSDHHPSNHSHESDNSSHRPPRRVSSTPHGFIERSSPPSAFQHYTSIVPPVPPIPPVHHVVRPPDATYPEPNPTHSGQTVAMHASRSPDQVETVSPEATVEPARPPRKSAHRLQKRSQSQVS